MIFTKNEDSFHKLFIQKVDKIVNLLHNHIILVILLYLNSNYR
jgi:hypothetical protein